MTEKLKILFLCTGNSCRSQMAEGWTRHLQNNRIDVYSAGTEIHGLNPHAVTVMAEEGIDISDYQSQSVDHYKNDAFDYVITVCDHARETCPLFPGDTRIIHVGFEDPPALAEHQINSEKKLNCYRKVRDEIKTYILTLPESLTG